MAAPPVKAPPPALPIELRDAYVRAIMNSSSTELPRLECPEFDTKRYEYLIPNNNTAPTIQYFFALDLKRCLPILPRLIGTLVEVIRFLGPANCAVSIVEGNSDDGTAEVLSALRGPLTNLPTTYHLRSSAINPSTGDRIPRLAALRNLALQPLLTTPRSFLAPPNETTIIFLNDVAPCPDDILELLHQRRRLKAHMTCAMDWTYVGRDPTFYDMWIARGMTGDAFFEVPPDGNWNSAWNLFWNDADTQARYAAHQSFQVFSCWNGATAFTAEPILLEKVAFRGPRLTEGECMQGEPQLFCKDLWWQGYKRIAVVPSISLEYSDERAKQIKEAKGWTSRWLKEADAELVWREEPPEKVKCIPNYENQTWEAWNKSQPGV